MTVSFLCALLVAGWASLLAPPPPKPPATASSQRILVLPRVTGTELPAQRRALIEQSVNQGLSRGRAETTAPAGPVAVDCDAACRRHTAAAVNADVVVVAEVSVDHDDYEATLSLYDAGSGKLVARRPVQCLTCGLDEARGRIEDAAADLRRRAEATRPGPARFDIDSRPTGAQVAVDGKVAGLTPLSLTLKPGPHEVSLQHSGHHRVSKRITAVDGVREELAFELEPAPPPNDRRRGMGMIGTGAALMGTGAGFLAAGITFVALDGRPYRLRCSAADVDAQGNCRSLWASQDEGIAFTVVGGVALAAATALLVRGVMRYRASRRAAGPSARRTHGRR